MRVGTDFMCIFSCTYGILLNRIPPCDSFVVENHRLVIVVGLICLGGTCYFKSMVLLAVPNTKDVFFFQNRELERNSIQSSVIKLTLRYKLLRYYGAFHRHTIGFSVEVGTRQIHIQQIRMLTCDWGWNCTIHHFEDTLMDLLHL